MSIIHINKTEQLADLATQNRWVLIDFWSSCCASCQRLGIVFERVASRYQSNLLAVRTNIDQLEEIAAFLNVRSVPTLVLLHEGELVDKMVGHHAESEINRWLINHDGLGI
jgi:thioredoxin-like negative regulator of GroEL